MKLLFMTLKWRRPLHLRWHGQSPYMGFSANFVCPLFILWSLSRFSARSYWKGGQLATFHSWTAQI